MEVYTGYRPQHDSVRGPFKGGLRYHPDVTREEFESRDVTWRDAAYIVALSRVAEAHEARGLWP